MKALKLLDTRDPVPTEELRQVKKFLLLPKKLMGRWGWGWQVIEQRSLYLVMALGMKNWLWVDERFV